MSKSTRIILALLIAAAWLGCGDDTELPVLNTPDGLSVQDFPIRNGAVWVYENEANPAEAYRLSVEGTRIISSYLHWKLSLTALDGSGAPISGEAPAASDYYAANGLHQRLTALTSNPGSFTSALFVLWPRAEEGETLAFPIKRPAALTTFPVGAVYWRLEMPENLGLLGNVDDPNEDGDDSAEATYGTRTEPIRYDEVTTGTVGYVLETASEGSDPAQFQKHLPPRRMWQFPLQIGNRWRVFETYPLPPAGNRGAQPVLHGERMVVRQENVSVPGYSGPALVVEEWVVGIDPDPDTGAATIPALTDTNNDGEIDRGEPSARYWVAAGVGIVKYEYEIFDLDLFRQWQEDATSVDNVFVPKTFVLMRATIPDSERAATANQ